MQPLPQPRNSKTILNWVIIRTFKFMNFHNTKLLLHLKEQFIDFLNLKSSLTAGHPIMAECILLVVPNDCEKILDF